MSRWVGRRIYREIRACCWTISHHQAPFYILFDWSDFWEFDHTWGKLRTVPQLSPGEDSWRSRVHYRLKRVRSICHCHPTCNKSVFLVNMGHIEGWNRRQIKNWEKQKKKKGKKLWYWRRNIVLFERRPWFCSGVTPAFDKMSFFCIVYCVVVALRTQ